MHRTKSIVRPELAALRYVVPRGRGKAAAWAREHEHRTKRNIRMRKKLLLSTAALLAGIAVASAQSMPGGGQQGSSAGQDRQQSTQGRGNQAQQGAQGQERQGQDRQGQSQRSEGQGEKGQTSGQASPRQTEQ